MKSNAKRSHLGVTVDRISILPRNLIDLILQCLPLHEAARTSILSNTWKNIWGTQPHLVFDEKFFSHLAPKDNIQAELHTVTRIVSNILLFHSGPTLKFHLSIPKDLPLHECQDTDIWIKHISNNGVRILELFNKAPVAYKLPSYLFSCLELTNLWLNNCILHPPLRFRGFYNLKSVKLLDVKIAADLSFGLQLEELDLERCTGLEHLGCQFKYNNKLTTLRICASKEINWRWFKCTKNVQKLALLLKRVEYSNGNIISFDKLVGYMPRLYCLQLDGFYLEYLEPVAGDMKMIVTTMEIMESLYLYSITFYNLSHIKNVLCLIKASPNLRYLHIELKECIPSTISTFIPRVLKVVIKDLQSSDFFSLRLDQLEMVKIVGMMGLETELYFIKFLLASSPSLKWMKLVSNSTINDPSELYRISRELMRFPRASPAAQIIFN